MKFDDASKDDSYMDKKEENYFDGIEPSVFTKKKSGIRLTGILEMPTLLYITGGIVLVVLVGWIVLQAGKSFDSNSLDTMDTRLKQIEDRFIDLGLMEKKLTQIEAQTEKIDNLYKRIETMEANLSARIEHLSTQLKSANRKIEEKKPVIAPKTKGKAAKKPKASSKIYHQVQSGETLYSIGRAYQLSIKELEKLNPSLRGKKNIYPGQKLRIKKR